MNKRLLFVLGALFLSLALSAQSLIPPANPSAGKSNLPVLTRSDKKAPTYNSQKPSPVAKARIPESYESSKGIDIPEGKVRIIFAVTHITNGGGHQLLLDKSHTMYGVEIPIMGDFAGIGENVPDVIYNKFTYKIPSTANGKLYVEGTTIQDKRDTIYIDPGMYDFCIVNPQWRYSAGAGPRYQPVMRFCLGDHGRVNDYTFVAGYTYTIIAQMSEDGYDDESDMRMPFDVRIVCPLSPVSDSLTATKKVAMNIQNCGRLEGPIENLKMSYSIDGGAPRTQDLAKLDSGESLHFTFDGVAKLDKVKEKCTIKAWISHPSDPFPFNDTIRYTVYNQTPLATFPHLENFPVKEQARIAKDWVSIDHNGDGTVWRLAQAVDVNSDATLGAMREGYRSDRENDDYLISRPLRLAAGDYHIEYSVYSPTENPEIIEIYFGKDKHIDSLERLQRSYIYGIEWRRRITNLHADVDGIYYVAFRQNTYRNGMGSYLDSLEIKEGKVEVYPELTAYLTLPVSACDLDSVNMAVELNNVGNGVARNISVTIYKNDVLYCVETIKQQIGADSLYTYKLETKLGVGELKKYTIKAVVNCDGEQAEATSTNDITHYSPLAPPQKWKFSESTDWNPRYEGAWFVDQGYNINMGGAGPLLSRCMTLKKGTPYRFSYVYNCGQDFSGRIMTATFYVALGKVGQPDNEWDTLDFHLKEYTKQIVNKELTFIPKEDGEYVIGFFTRNCFLFALTSCEIDSVYNDDSRLNAIINRSFAYRLPQEQFMGNHEIWANVENRGYQPLDNLTLTAWDGASSMGKYTLPTLKTDTALWLPTFKVTPTATHEVGYAGEIKFTLFQDKIEQDSSDNILKMQYGITDTVYGFDLMDAGDISEAFGLGSFKGPIAVGHLYNLTASDTLTSISTAFSEVKEACDVEVSVYPARLEESVYMKGDAIVRKRITREQRCYFTTIDLVPVALPAGLYYVEISQLGMDNMAVLIDGITEIGEVFVTENDTLMSTPFYGSLWLRMNFGHNRLPVNNDIAVMQGESPNQLSWSFGDNESLQAVIANQRNTTEQNVKLYCQVDNEEPTMKNIAELKAFETKTTTFRTDKLATRGKHTVKFFISCAADNNHDNDTIIINLESRDTYPGNIMNFEDCGNFATQNFSPKWTAVNAFDTLNRQLDYLTFPNVDEKFGLIVINPSKTNPVSTKTFPTKHGERHGAFLATRGAKVSSAWFISPNISVAAVDAKMVFNARGYSDKTPEKFEVMISTSDKDTANFIALGDPEVAEIDEWGEHTYDLSEYAGQNVHLAIHYISMGGSMMMIDDIRIDGTSAKKPQIVPEINLFPNPAHDQVTITNGNKTIKMVEIYDESGRLVLSQEVRGTECRISVTGWKKGLYFVAVRTDEGRFGSKLIID